MKTTVFLSDEIAEKARVLASRLNVSLDELSAIALKELLKKYSGSSNADLDFEQKIEIAQRGMQQYRKALVELGK